MSAQFGVMNAKDDLLFAGNHAECVIFMKTLYNLGQKPEIDFDLKRVTKVEHGQYEIGCLCSYVL